MGDLDFLGAENTLYIIDKAILDHFTSESPRTHLGASSLGNPCMRALWYQFRWHPVSGFPANMYRLFQRGHREEAVFIEYYKMAGIKVVDRDKKGNQFWFSAKGSGGHIGGSTDGFIKGLVERPNDWHVVDFKTSNNTKFNELVKKGVKEAQPRHYSQLNLYMHWSGVHKAFYHSVNKNNDKYHAEYIEYDKELCLELEEKGFKVIKSHVPPDRLSNKPDWWQCKMCEFHETCHYNKKRSINCRTCRFSKPILGDNNDKMWFCNKHDKTLTTKMQIEACKNWSDIEHD